MKDEVKCASTYLLVVLINQDSEVTDTIETEEGWDGKRSVTISIREIVVKVLCSIKPKADYSNAASSIVDAPRCALEEEEEEALANACAFATEYIGITLPRETIRKIAPECCHFSRNPNANVEVIGWHEDARKYALIRLPNFVEW